MPFAPTLPVVPTSLPGQPATKPAATPSPTPSSSEWKKPIHTPVWLGASDKKALGGYSRIGPKDGAPFVWTDGNRYQATKDPNGAFNGYKSIDAYRMSGGMQSQSVYPITRQQYFSSLPGQQWMGPQVPEEDPAIAVDKKFQDSVKAPSWYTPQQSPMSSIANYPSGGGISNMPSGGGMGGMTTGPFAFMGGKK